jgi:hypothetical protein
MSKEGYRQLSNNSNAADVHKLLVLSLRLSAAADLTCVRFVHPKWVAMLRDGWRGENLDNLITVRVKVPLYPLGRSSQKRYRA